MTMVVDRFEGYYAKDIRCRIWTPTDQKNGEKTPSMLDDFFIAIKRFNCICTQGPCTENGYHLLNESYTGVIGKFLLILLS